MTTEEFVKAFYTEKQDFLKEYLSENSETDILRKIPDSSFNDIFYSILLGLDGCASIGGIQEIYDLKDEDGNQISGEIEGYAYEYFHEYN